MSTDRLDALLLEAFELGHWAWPTAEQPTRRAIFEDWLTKVKSGDPGVAVAPPRQALVQAIRRAEDQQTILDLCDQLDKQFAALRQELGERDKFRDEIYKPQLALLREQLTTLEALWAEVGQHIDAAAIGYNHPQIRAVFTENRRLSADLAAVRAVAPPPEPI